MGKVRLSKAAGNADTGLACLCLIARYHQLPADEQQLRREFVPPGKAFDALTLVRAARSLGLRARQLHSRVQRLEKTPLPAIAERHDGRFVVLARLGDGQVLLHDPREGRTRALPIDEFAQEWSGWLILVTRRTLAEELRRKFDIAWFIPAFARYRRIFGEVLLASFFIQLFALVTPLFFQVIVDKVLVHKGLTTLDVLAVGFLIIAVFDVLLGGLRTYLFSHTTNRVDVELGARLYRHLLALPISYFEARRVGDSVARVRELETIRSFITGSALTLVIDLFFTLVFLAVMYFYSATLLCVVVASIPLYVLLSMLVTPMLRTRLNEKFRRGAENQAFLVESVSGVETIKAMAVEPQMRARWEEQLAGYVKASFRATNLSNIANQGASFINKLTTLLILWLGARLVIDADLTVGQLVAFNMLAGRVSAPILRLVQLWQDFQQAGISVARLGDILNAPTEPGYNPNRAALPAVKGDVRLEHVSFRYRPDGSETLKDLTLHAAPGEVIGLVGRSGSGKSTLTKLVQRLHVPESGRVLVDGVDLRLVDTAWLRRNIGVVLQESRLFNRTVRENIALAEPGLSMECVVAAAQLAGAHEFILELPEGYDTLVGEHGANLSGGQRQRIAIARALIMDPKILIFDEATSALDYESERIIQQNLRRIVRGRTVFIIAHRLSAVRDVDRIIVLEKGRIVQAGRHEELLRRHGPYARLHALQDKTNGAEPLADSGYAASRLDGFERAACRCPKPN
ncbi:type I secretion system permease/ATPase [Nitrococcus mobilis]|uniref:ABC-type bacteriocin/lantibiotic exporter n=1 Tax=Nitrococcus mobilis Nb-231 TaxID=314278 RepID=A4BV67_9GAMM|nr:type I secretion system permease/ATPase [Nitrococcus mobilis]EAR20409.1 ABC-type bacteriocin/lantibiotic exporter [Nitrococcus mobilis Nb-231]